MKGNKYRWCSGRFRGGGESRELGWFGNGGIVPALMLIYTVIISIV